MGRLSEGESRRTERYMLALETRVRGFESSGRGWTEDTITDSVSAYGVSFPLNHRVERGLVLHLDLPLPRGYRDYDRTAASYAVYTLVRNTVTLGEVLRVGVMFLGKEPPRGYDNRPAALYLLPSDRASQRQETVPPAPGAAAALTPDGGRRRSERYNLELKVVLQETDEWGVILREELTVADNISNGGARIATTLDFSPGDVVFLLETGGTFATAAVVRDLTVGRDRLKRIHVEFLGEKRPEHLIPH